MTAHIPAPLLWELTRGRSAFTVKRRTGGGAEFSRDPLNLVNKHTRRHDGYINDKAIGLQTGEKGSIQLLTKKADKANKPASQINTVSFKWSTPSRKLMRNVSSNTGKRGYRTDLNAAAVRRASALKKAGQPTKADPAKKVRGAKAKKAAAEKA